MSKDTQKLRIIDQKSNEDAGKEEQKEGEQESDYQNLKLMAMEDLVPITQTLIPPSLARFFNLNVQPQFLEEVNPTERSHAALFNDELQHMQLRPADYHSSKEEEEDSKRSADDPCLQIMMRTSISRSCMPACYRRPYFNAGLEGYSAQLGDDGTDDQKEDYSMNHLVERENSSNSGDGTGSGGGGSGGGGSARTLKRPRLVWTPQLHKRFVDAVSHLGIKNAVPKTIMQLMNVEGLTRENVASHLQKYRLYLRRVHHGNLFSSCANSSNKPILGGVDHPHLMATPFSPLGNSDHLFSSSSSIPSTNRPADNHAQHHRHRIVPSHIIPMQSLPLQHTKHQLNQAMAIIKSPPFTNQHLNPKCFSSNSVNSSSALQGSSWPSSHSSIIDINALHHVESHGSAGSSSPRRQALTLFPH